MGGQQNRVLRYAILLSLCLHAVLALWGPRFRESAPPAAPPAPLLARLVEPPAPAAPPTPVVEKAKEEAPPKPPVAQKKPVEKKKAIEKKKQPIVRQPKPAPPPPPLAPVAPVEEPPQTAAAEPPPPAQPTLPLPPAVTMEPGPAQAPSPSPPLIASPTPAPQQPVPPAQADAGSLGQYRIEVLSVARRLKRYPRVALDNAWEGDVVVRMVIGPSGGISTLTVQASSGHAILDREAVEMFRKAAARVQVPPALRGREFTLELRAIYNLKDQESG